MKNIILARSLLFVVLLMLGAGFSRLAGASSFAEDSHQGDGLGVIVGEPTGVTGKFWVAPEQAIDVGVGFTYSDFAVIYGDYLFHFHGAFGLSNEFLAHLEPYMGVGGELFLTSDDAQARADGHFFESGNDSSAGFGIRIPVGAEWFLPRAPLAVFAEIVPGIGIAPGVFGFFQTGVGIRFYF